MNFSKMIEHNSNEFIRDLKVAFFDVTARNQAFMDQIEMALSKEEDPDKINSLQSLWTDYHEAVKGCIGGANLIATSFLKLQECSNLFDLVMNDKTDTSSVAVDSISDAENKDIPEAVVEVPEEAINEVSPDNIVPVENDKIEDNTVSDDSAIDEAQSSAIQEENADKPVEISSDAIDSVMESSVSPDNVADVPNSSDQDSVPTIVENPAAKAPETTMEESVSDSVPTIVENPVATAPETTMEEPVSDSVPTIVESSVALTPENVADAVAQDSAPSIVESSVEIVSETDGAVPTIIESTPVVNSEAAPEEANVVSNEQPVMVDSNANIEVNAQPETVSDAEVEMPAIISNVPLEETVVSSEAPIPSTSSIPTVSEAIEKEAAAVEETSVPINSVVETAMSVGESAIPEIVLPTITEAASMTESDPTVESSVSMTNEEAVAPDVVLPTIAEAQNTVVEEKKTIPVSEDSVSSEPVIPLPQIEEDTVSDNSDPSGIMTLSTDNPAEDTTMLATFVKTSMDEGKAILVTKSQAQKLRGSKDLQSALIRSMSPVTVNTTTENEEITESKLEDMMNQLSSLYEQGKMEEAEKMSERISVLSKKLNPAA